MAFPWIHTQRSSLVSRMASITSFFESLFLREALTSSNSFRSSRSSICRDFGFQRAAYQAAYVYAVLSGPLL